MKTFLFFAFFLFGGLASFSQDLYIYDLPKKVSDKIIMEIVKKAQVENGINVAGIIHPGQRIRLRLPDGWSLMHTVARGENLWMIVRNYLTIPNYEELVKPQKRGYQPTYTTPFKEKTKSPEMRDK